jgi:hypothetical protein
MDGWAGRTFSHRRQDTVVVEKQDKKNWCTPPASRHPFIFLFLQLVYIFLHKFLGEESETRHKKNSLSVGTSTDLHEGKKKVRQPISSLSKSLAQKIPPLPLLSPT